MSLFIGENVETASWTHNATTHASGSKEKLGDKYGKVTPSEETKEEDFGDYHTDLDEHDDINLWVGKGPTKR